MWVLFFVFLVMSLFCWSYFFVPFPFSTCNLDLCWYSLYACYTINSPAPPPHICFIHYDPMCLLIAGWGWINQPLQGMISTFISSYLLFSTQKMYCQDSVLRYSITAMYCIIFTNAISFFWISVREKLNRRERR